jgi:hypothetical protein
MCQRNFGGLSRFGKIINLKTVEKIEKITEAIKPKTVEEAVKCFQDDNRKATIEFLRNNGDDVGEFCLQVRDHYAEKDSTTPFLKLSILIKDLL